VYSHFLLAGDENFDWESIVVMYTCH